MEDVSKFLTSAITTGINPESLKLWWHSHVNAGCFWSGTDEATIERFSNGWMLSIVGNKLGEYKARVDLYEPFRITIDELPLTVAYPIDKGLRVKVEDEIKEKVHKTFFPTWKGGDPNWGLPFGKAKKHSRNRNAGSNFFPKQEGVK